MLELNIWEISIIKLEGKATEDTGEGEVQFRMSQARKSQGQHSLFYLSSGSTSTGYKDILNTQAGPSALTKRNKVAVEIRAVFGFWIP